LLPPGAFGRGLRRLVESGFRSIPLQEIVACVSGSGCFPAHGFAITFDDGYESVYREAFPDLQEQGMTATVFLTAGRKKPASGSERLPPVCGRTMLSWDQIREMHRAGICFGAHTLTHPDLTRPTPSEMKTEILYSQALLEDALGVPVRTFAYPFGRLDARSRDAVRRNFDLACTDNLGFVSAASDVFALPRIDAYYLRSESLFARMLSPWFRGYVTARAVPRALRRSLSALWGT
jgi:peptidoglycan/xylan/chitin deacetylase (PgdA/CDA1 family)